MEVFYGKVMLAYIIWLVLSYRWCEQLSPAGLKNGKFTGYVSIKSFLACRMELKDSSSNHLTDPQRWQ